MKWGLPGDFTGGFIIFGIMFFIAFAELYIVRAAQSRSVGVTFTPIGGSGGASLGDVAKGTIGQSLADCEETWKGNKKRIQRCKDAIRGAKEGGGGKGCKGNECEELVAQQ